MNRSVVPNPQRQTNREKQNRKISRDQKWEQSNAGKNIPREVVQSWRRWDQNPCHVSDK